MNGGEARRRHDTGVAEADSHRLSGLTSPPLHDRMWAARGLPVVRTGPLPPAPDALGRGPWLLLDRDTLVDGDLSEPVRGLRRRRLVSVDLPRVDALRPRLASTEAPHAAPDIRPIHITSDRTLAARWSMAEDATALLPNGTTDAHPAITTSAARWYDGSDALARRRWRLDALRGDASIAAICPGLSMREPGVWIHETAEVHSDVRFAPPVWIGAGVRLGSGHVVVGPAVLDDRVHVPALPVAPTVTLSARPSVVRSEDRVAAGRAPRGKRLFDIAFAAAALCATAPLFVLCMAAIRLEDGAPVLFSHERQAIGGRSFRCLKFRTMCRDAEQTKRDLADANVCDGPQFFVENDPRLLRVGRWLRRFHLDELPQFINVLRGEMSVVGPRPSPEEENRCCRAWQEARLSVKPGITGLWQVRRTRAKDTDFQEWIRYDLEYVARRSWRMDLRILAETVGRVVFGDRSSGRR